MARTFGECARDAFVIDDSIPEDDPMQKGGVKIRFFEASGEALSQLGRTFGQERRRMFELLSVVSERGHDRADVTSVVGIELALNQCLWIHARVFMGVAERLQEDCAVTAEMQNAELNPIWPLLFLKRIGRADFCAIVHEL